MTEKTTQKLTESEKVSVSTTEVAKAYLTAEIGKIFSGDNLQSELEGDIGRLLEKETWRLLEALSFTYRLNAVFWTLSDDGFVWSKEEVSCGNLVLTGMTPQIDKVTYSEAVQNNPLKFRDYLITYFKKFPDSDPEGLGQFRPKGTNVEYPTIILVSRDEKLRLLDGSNRLMAQLLNGQETINAYIGKKVKDGKMKLGDSTFWLLRKAYETGDENTKQAILTVVKELVNLSSDGKEAVQAYWIDHIRDEALKEPGKQILAKQENGDL